MHLIQDDTRIMNNNSPGTGLAGQVYDRNNVMLTMSDCIVSRGLQYMQLVKLDIGHLRHCKICIMSQYV